MALPATRTEFKNYCLRQLGSPVLEINVDDDQVSDNVDLAVRKYQDFHFNGTKKRYYKHTVIADNITNGYITLPEEITGVVGVFNISNQLASNNIFNVRYQMALNDLYSLTNVSVVPYYMSFQHLALIEQILLGAPPIVFNRNEDKLYIMMDWSTISVGQYIVIETYEALDPDTYTDIWSDLWLLEYGTALIKKQWGTNLKKFQGLALPGNLTMNGQIIFDEAMADIARLESELINTYSIPAADAIG